MERFGERSMALDIWRLYGYVSLHHRNRQPINDGSVHLSTCGGGTGL